MIFSIAQINMVSALDLDNYKKFNKDVGKYGKIEVWENEFFSNDYQINNYLLVEHRDSVLTGYSKVSVEVFEESRLIDKLFEKDNKKELKKLDIVVKKEVENTKQKLIINNSIDGFTDIIIGHENYTIKEYEIINYKLGDYVIPGNYTIELFAERDNMNTGPYDWIFETMGIETTEYAEWWNSSYSFKKLIEVTNNNATNIFNYSVRLNITYDADMQSDFDDLRFLNSSETGELPYYIESKVDSSYAIVWIKLDLQASATDSVYMYFGNPTAISASDIKNSFQLGENWSSLDQWNTVSGSPTVSGNILSVNNAVILSKLNFSINTILETQSKWGSTAEPFRIGYDSDGVVDGNGNLFYYQKHTGGTTYTNTNNGGTQTQNARGIIHPAGVWFNESFTRVSTAKAWFNWSANNYEHTTTIPIIPLPIMINSGSAGTADQIARLWVRGYVYPEPTYTIGAKIDNTNLTVSTSLISPDDNFITNKDYILFNVSSSATGGVDLINVTLNITNSTTSFYTNTQTLSGNTTVYTTWNVTNIDDGNYNWTATTYGTNETNNTATLRKIKIDTILPTINIISPLGQINYKLTSTNLSLNWTVSDTNLQSCWFEYNNINTTVTCGNNNYSFTPTSQKTLIFYANDTAGNLGYANTSWSYKILENNQSYNSSAYRTSKESFTLNMSSDGTQTVTANLYYGGVKYAATKSGDNSNMKFTKSFDLNSLGNITHFWSVNYGNENINLSTNYQNVEDIYFVLCNATITNRYMNITFKDEADFTKLNASIPEASFNYWLGDGTVNKTYDFLNVSYNYEYDFCFSAPDKTIKNDIYMQYSGDGYPQRIYDPSVLSLSNITTNKTLYLLASADGLYVTFQVIDSTTNTISGVDVTATRIISGEEVVVGQGITGASGTVTFWLNPDFLHTFSFTKDGYTSYEYTENPTQSSYTISLGTGTTTNAINYYRGMNFRIKPTNDFLTYGNNYNFNLTLTSDYWTVEEYGFTLYYDNKTSISSINDTTNGGILSINNVAVISPSIYMRYYYIINGTTIYSGSARTWTGDNFTQYNYSLLNLFSNIQRDMSEESLLGATDFTRLIFSFVLIIMMVGGVGFRFGIKNQAFVGGILWSTVILLDWTLNFIPYLSIGDNIVIPYFPSAMITLIFGGLLIKEAMR